MSPVMSEIEKNDFILCLLNQVIYKTDMYGHTKMDAGGGVGLKHDIHFSTKITKGSDEWDGNFLIKRTSVIDIDKSKISPEIVGIPFVMDIRNGGKINEEESFISYLFNIGWIPNERGWYTFTDMIKFFKDHDEYDHSFIDALEKYDKKYRWADLVKLVENDEILYNILRYEYMDYISDMYRLQRKVIEEYKNECKEYLNNALGLVSVDPEFSNIISNPDDSTSNNS